MKTVLITKRSLTQTILLTAIVIFLGLSGFYTPGIEGLDGAHHLMDGVFFYDIITDSSIDKSVSGVLDYYRQYPALGFIFWPPLFPIVESIVFLITGPGKIGGLMTILGFGALFANSFYYLLSRLTLSENWRFFCTALCLSLPALTEYMRVIMLEIPATAMMTLTALLYCRFIEQQTHLRLAALVIIAAAAIYTKQTTLVIIVAIFIHGIIYHSHLLRRPAVWVGILGCILLLAPIIGFTLRFGQANIAQSLGNGTDQIMASYQGLPRWSLSNWLFYPSSMILALGPILSALLAYMLFSISLFQRRPTETQSLFLLWTIAFYVFFSYFDNKTHRFTTMILPPLVAIATQGAALLWEKIGQHPTSNKGTQHPTKKPSFVNRWIPRLSSHLKVVLPSYAPNRITTPLAINKTISLNQTLFLQSIGRTCLIVILGGLLIWNIAVSIKSPVKGVVGLGKIAHVLSERSSLHHPERGMNMMYHGEFRQIMVFHMRLKDEDKSSYQLQADDLLQLEQPLSDILRKFKVRYIAFEADRIDQFEKRQLNGHFEWQKLLASGEVKPLEEYHFDANNSSRTLMVFEYTGRMEQAMAPIELNSKFL